MTSLTTLLFGSDAEPGDTLETLRGRLRPAVPTDLPVPHALGDLPVELAVAILDLLQMPLGRIALAAWDRHERVRAACERTARKPRRRERFPLEPLPDGLVLRVAFGQDLDRDLAAEHRVGGAVDIAHAAASD